VSLPLVATYILGIVVVVVDVVVVVTVVPSQVWLPLALILLLFQ